MAKRKKTNKTSGIPKPKILPVVKPVVEPEEPIPPGEDPEIIPDEDPFENPPPFEIPEPGEGP